MRKLALILGLLLVVALNANADDRLAKAMDWAAQTGRPWNEIQGKQPFDRGALNALDAMLDGTANFKLVEQFARSWDAKYDDERRDALVWADAQADLARTHYDLAFWVAQTAYLEQGDIRYLDDARGTDPDDMRKWAYYLRFYGKPKAARAVPEESESTSWGAIKGLYR